MISKSNVFVGIKPHGDSVACEAGKSKLEKYDYILLPLTNTRYRESMKQRFEKYRNEADPLRELKLDAPQLQELGIPPSTGSLGDVSYIGLVSSFLELESSDADVRNLSLQVLIHELEYAKFVGIKQVILAPPRNLNTLHYYAQSLSHIFDLFGASCPNIAISLPLFEDSDPLSTWELWNTIRKMCDYNANLCVSLALPRQKTPSYVLSRWLSEPVSCLLVSASVFTTNRYDYPVLNKFNQHVVTEFQCVNGNASKFGELVIILHGMEKHSISPSHYLEYINYLLKKGDRLILSQMSDPADNISSIMPPLLPHHDNLSNEVYQTFEKDKVKYDLYEEAITKALRDLVEESSSKWRRSNKMTVLVAGAGRGPLVDKTFKVLNILSISNFRLLAIEKNPQALLYLQKRNFEHWDNKVELIKTDLREWDDEVLIDLCISELLGSFGCNELSPECITPIELYHSKHTTKFIPQSYSSYAVPVSSPILYQSLKEKGLEYLEQPSIIHNIPYCKTAFRVNEIWEFPHYHDQQPQLNKTSVSQFRIKHKSEIHGIAGYFIATLYDDIQLSTVPDESIIKTLEDQDMMALETSRGQHSSVPVKANHTKNMKSWSPIFFPLNEPLYINDDTELELFITRNHANEKVWYEWSLSTFVYLVTSESNNSREEPPASTQLKSQSDNETNNLTKAFARFNNKNQPSEETDTKFFEDSINHTNFMSNKANEWESVKDLHEINNSQAPLLESEEAVQHNKSFLEEYHVRVRTAVTKLHNVNGNYYSIPL